MSSDDGAITVVLIKHRDIPGLVADGFVHIGVTSLEWVAETERDLQVHQQLDWCHTRVSLLVPSARPFAPSASRPLRCVTEFPNLASKYLPRAVSTTFETRTVSGSTEGLVPRLFDCAIDCVETGATAQRHGLREEAVILESAIVVISRKASSPAIRELARLIT
jgi:ATP phosphoribosyltransferase